MADTQHAGSGNNDGAGCLVCHKHPVEYECMPCRHATLCKGCAMKQATGGRCKVCHELFSELRRKRDHADDDNDDEDEDQDDQGGERDA